MTVSKKDVYNHIAEALLEHLTEADDAQVGMDNDKLFLRMDGQVFSIAIEERTQFRFMAKPALAASNFMSSLPIVFKRT